MFNGLDDLVAVIFLIGNNVLCRKSREQQLSLHTVGRLPRRQDEPQRIVQPIHRRVDVGDQPAFRTAKGFRLLSPPFAPTAC